MRANRKTLSSRHLRSFAHRRYDAVMSAAPTEIAGHIFTNLAIAARMTLANAGNRRHDLARRAIAALESIMLKKRRLHRMKGAVCRGEAFDCRDLPPLGLGRKRETGKDAP